MISDLDGSLEFPDIFLVWSRSILIQRRASFDRTRFLQWFKH